MTDTSKKPYWGDALRVFARMSSWIVGPVILGLFLGKWLDKKFGTAPLLFAATIGLAFVVSSIGIAREAGKYIKSIPSKKPDTNGTEHTDN